MAADEHEPDGMPGASAVGALGSMASRFVQRAAEILDEELGAARARGAGPADRAAAHERGDGPRDDLRTAVTTVVDRIVVAVDAVLGTTSGRFGDAPAEAPSAETSSAGSPSAEAPPSPAATPEGAVAVHRAAGPVASGATATVVVPLAADPTGGRRGPIVGGALLGAGRGRIPARAVGWTPRRLEDAGPDGVVVTVDVPPGTAPGEYRVLLRGAGFEAVVAVAVAG
jgi:hypothetical protein